MKLAVYKLDRPTWLLGYRWAWEITDPSGGRLDASVAPSWSEALAVGLAALEAATLRAG